MQKFKAGFLLMGVLAVMLVVVFSSARRPVGRAAGEGIAESMGGRGAGRIAEDARAIANGGNVKDVRRMTDAGKAAAIEWMSVEDAAGRLQKEKRPVLIDLYTTWCGWCKQMDKKTYSNKKVAQYLQEKFYTVKVDAETHSAITWNGKTYQFSPRYRSNEFAVYLTHGRLEFPTTIIIPSGGEPQAIPGYMEPKELELLVKYFGEGQDGKISFDVYQKNFKTSW